ncbi:hypothetical protein FPV67DRAFT_1668703 [Lyophyllum atratum]|nr:hypothetical protein FPV67DRAFT_1668703 [Lyophyllum atratum]
MSLIPHPKVASWDTDAVVDMINRHRPRYRFRWTGLFFSPRTGMQGAKVPVPLDVGVGVESQIDGVVSQYWVPYRKANDCVYDLQVGRKSFVKMPGGEAFDGVFTIHYEDQKGDVAGPMNWPDWVGNVLVTKQSETGEMMNVQAKDVGTALELVGRAIDGGLLL